MGTGCQSSMACLNAHQTEPNAGSPPLDYHGLTPPYSWTTAQYSAGRGTANTGFAFSPLAVKHLSLEEHRQLTTNFSPCTLPHASSRSERCAARRSVRNLKVCSREWESYSLLTGLTVKPKQSFMGSVSKHKYRILTRSSS